MKEKRQPSQGRTENDPGNPLGLSWIDVEEWAGARGCVITFADGKGKGGKGVKGGGKGAKGGGKAAQPPGERFDPKKIACKWEVAKTVSCEKGQNCDGESLHSHSFHNRWRRSQCS